VPMSNVTRLIRGRESYLSSEILPHLSSHKMGVAICALVIAHYTSFMRGVEREREGFLVGRVGIVF